MPLEGYFIKLVDLVAVPFQHLGAVWLGLMPLYVSLILGELYRTKVTFGHAVGNGFVMVWAGLNWAGHLSGLSRLAYMFDSKTLPWLVTVISVAVGVFAIVLGFRKKDRALCEILGHTRYSGYFLILLYPMQIGLVRWNWPSMAAVLIFALPVWLLIYLAGRLLRACVT